MTETICKDGWHIGKISEALGENKVGFEVTDGCILLHDGLYSRIVLTKEAFVEAYNKYIVEEQT